MNIEQELDKIKKKICNCKEVVTYNSEVPGRTNVIYIDQETSTLYIWNGTAYESISGGGGTNQPLVYTAIINLPGDTSAPAPIILENTIGDIIWSRVSTGFYKATLIGTFPLDKTMLFINDSLRKPDTLTLGMSFFLLNEDEIVLQVFDPISETFSSDQIDRCYIKIEIYP